MTQKLRKTGRLIQQAFYQRDPLSPPFHVNLVLGLRFLQASLLVPLHRTANVGTRALPIRFQEVSRVKRPGKKASPEQLKRYKAAVKRNNLSHSFVQMGKQLREATGSGREGLRATDPGADRRRQLLQSHLLRRRCRQVGALGSRARKDAKLCFRASLPTQTLLLPLAALSCLDLITLLQQRNDPTNLTTRSLCPQTQTLPTWFRRLSYA